IDILDTRGLGESHQPEEAALTEDPVEEVKRSISTKCPDVILFLCKGKEAGARLDDDIKQLLQLNKEITEQHSYDVPIVSSVTQVVLLSPVLITEQTFDHPKHK